MRPEALDRPMKTMTAAELVDEMYRANGQLALFLGAGASQSSGIPPAAELVRQWEKERYERDKGRRGGISLQEWKAEDAKRYEAWLAGQGRNPGETDRRYAYNFQYLEATRRGRQEVIAKLCEAASPQAGY